MLKRTLLFLLLNFAALAIGGLFTGPGVDGDWYTGLAKAPWTPPGWVFGAAWTTIMLAFAPYMARLTGDPGTRAGHVRWYAAQWVLNVAWNPLFFAAQAVLPALLTILALTVVVGRFLFAAPIRPWTWRLLVLPYFLWLCVAASLNAYIWWAN